LSIDLISNNFNKPVMHCRNIMMPNQIRSWNTMYTLNADNIKCTCSQCYNLEYTQLLRLQFVWFYFFLVRTNSQYLSNAKYVNFWLLRYYKFKQFLIQRLIIYEIMMRKFF